MSTSDPSRGRPLPHDPDLEVDEGPGGTTVPVDLAPRFVALVVVGGAFGTLARDGTDRWLGSSGGVPISTFVVNIVGAFVLGVLLEWMSGRGPGARRRRATRLLVGTGFLGGFTTYSALAVETDGLLRDGRLGLALAYAAATVVLGLVASLAGILLGRRVSS